MKSGPYLLMLGSVVTAGLALGIFLFTTNDDGVTDNATGASVTVEGQTDTATTSGSNNLTASPPTGEASSAVSSANNSTSAAPSSATDEATSEIEIGINLARVRQDGTTVIAGHAIPGSTVNLIRNGKIIGTTIATDAGEWVIVPDIQLEAGSHLLSMEMITPDGERIVSPMAVVIDMPSAADTTASAEDKGTPLVALVPYTDQAGEVARVLQAPDESSLSGTPSSGDTNSSTADASVTDRGDGTDAVPPSIRIRVIQALSRDQLAVSGDARGGSSATLHVNSDSVDADLDDAGKFYAAAPIDPEAQVFRLRVEVNNADGEVLAQANLKLSRAQIQQTLANNSLVVVHRGDALWRIAYRTYGEGIRYVDIYRKNQKQIDDPDLIYPDQIFAIPNS